MPTSLRTRLAILLALFVASVSCGDDTNSQPTPDPIPQLNECRAPQWAGEAPTWGGRCRSVDDCLNPALPTTSCEGSTGGYCTERSGPDWGGEGQPCLSDPNSVGYAVGSFRKCLAACAEDADCRPGYHCATNLGGAGNGRACVAISDCETRGCNENAASEPHYCDDDASAGRCWVDRCVDAPCAADDFSTGPCERVGDARQCACIDGEYWDPDCQRCGGLDCSAEDLGRLAATDSASASGATCGAATDFDPTASGCTGYNAYGPERTYQVTLGPQTAATFTATPTTGFDLSLYVIESCFDFGATSCMFGEDAAGAEVAVVANDSDEEKTVVAVVDGAQPDSCGDFDLTVEPFAFTCIAEDLGTFTGTPITRLGENNCGVSTLYNPGLAGCTGAHATGSEKLYSLTLPAGATATVTMDPSGFDAELWQTLRCGDFGGAGCTTASDAGGPGAVESMTLANTGSTPVTHYIVADSFNVFAACGDYDLTID